MNNNYILVSNWDEVEKDNFYLSNKWGKDSYGRLDEVKQGRKLQKEGELYYGYIVDAKNYAIYYQLDANEVLINGDGEVIIQGESQVIDNDHKHQEEYNY